MGLIFQNELHDAFGTWPLAYIPYGGPNFGELRAIGLTVADGDDTAFYEAWTAAAERAAAEAQDAEINGRVATASELFLHASVFYGASYHPLYGAPTDPRLVMAFQTQTAALDKGLSLRHTGFRPLRIPLEGVTMPARFIPAQGYENQTRPLLILTNGYDATMTDLYFASAVAASRRGYHCLMFDGPGQGEMLYEYGIPLRPDWETVIRAVVDFASAIPVVDPERIALSGWSLGGYLGPRAASAEHRLAACIADPGQWSLAEHFRSFAIRRGATPEAAANLVDLEQEILDGMMHVVQSNPMMRWKIVQRGFWVHGVHNLRDFFRAAEAFTLEGRTDDIRCPTLLTLAEGDPLTSGTQAFFDRLRCPKTLLRFTEDQGAGGHCEMGNRTLANRRILDWLDEVMGLS